MTPLSSPVILVILGDLEIPCNEAYSGFLIRMILRKYDVVTQE